MKAKAAAELGLAPYDSADYLKTDEDVTAYMEACVEEGGDDPAFIAHCLGVVARARNIAQLARDTGMSREGIYKALSRDGNPSFASIVKVADALGFKIAFAPKAPQQAPAKAAASRATAKRSRAAAA